MSEQATVTITNGVSREATGDNLVPGEYAVTEDTSKNPEGMSLVGENGKKVEVARAWMRYAPGMAASG